MKSAAKMTKVVFVVGVLMDVFFDFFYDGNFLCELSVVVSFGIRVNGSEVVGFVDGIYREFVANLRVKKSCLENLQVPGKS